MLVYVVHGSTASYCFPRAKYILRGRFFFFFFKDAAPPELSPLPLHAAFPICPPHLAGAAALRAGLRRRARFRARSLAGRARLGPRDGELALDAEDRFFEGQPQVESKVGTPDRKSTRLNSSHLVISYAVFCLKK